MHCRRRQLIVLSIWLPIAVLATMFVLGQGRTVVDAASRMGSVDPALAILGAVVSALAIANRGLLNRASHRAVGLDAEVAEMTHTAAVGFAAQKLVKSAGAIGLAVFIRHGRRRGHAPSTVAAACVLSAAASFGALGVLLIAAIGVLAATGGLNGWWGAAAAGFAIYSVALVVVGTVLARSRRAAEALWRLAQRARHRVRRRKVGPFEPTPLPAGLYEAMDLARQRPAAVARVLVHAALSKLLGAVMLATAVAAVGIPIGPADALVIYATALAASLVSIVPGGVGTVEGSTVVLLVGAGASAGVAALAVALFRLFDLWIPVVTGAVAARGELRAMPAYTEPLEDTVVELGREPRPTVDLPIALASVAA